MPENSDKTLRSGKAPTSFNLDPDLIYRLKNACAQHRRKQSEAVAEAIDDWLKSVTGQSEGSAENVTQLPGPFTGLSDDQIWTIYSLINILRAQPQGAIFRSLEQVLHNAILEFHRLGHPAAHRPPGLFHKRNIGTLPDAELQSEEIQIAISKEDAPWVQKLLKVLHSPKPGLRTAAENNMIEFDWASDAWGELRGQGSPIAAAPAPGADRSRTTPRQLAPPPGAGRDRGGHPEPEADISARIDTLEKAKGRSQKRATGTHDKSR